MKKKTDTRLSELELNEELSLVIYSFATEKKEPKKKITPAEKSVAKAWLAGESARSIAKKRDVSARTINNQIQSLYDKFDVHSRTDLANAIDLPSEN